MIRHVIWDWNGTLLDDLEASVRTLASLLDERGLPGVTSDEYRARFGFPVRAFYEGLGFDFAREDFGALSVAFIDRYRRRAGEMALAPGALAALEALQAGGVRHVVVSAMESRLLGEMLTEHGVSSWLDDHHGRGDLHAGSKVEVGVAAVRARGLDPDEVVVVGDTLHDHELAQAIGCRSILYCGGHQSRARLAAAGTTLIERFEDLSALLL